MGKAKTMIIRIHLYISNCDRLDDLLLSMQSRTNPEQVIDFESILKTPPKPLDANTWRRVNWGCASNVLPNSKLIRIPKIGCNFIIFEVFDNLPKGIFKQLSFDNPAAEILAEYSSKKGECVGSIKYANGGLEVYSKNFTGTPTGKDWTETIWQEKHWYEVAALPALAIDNEDPLWAKLKI